MQEGRSHKKVSARRRPFVRARHICSSCQQCKNETHGAGAYGVGPVGEAGDEFHVRRGHDGRVEGDDAGGREQLLGVPPVGEPGSVVRHAHGPLVLRHLHVPGLQGHVRGEPGPPEVAHGAQDGYAGKPVRDVLEAAPHDLPAHGEAGEVEPVAELHGVGELLDVQGDALVGPSRVRVALPVPGAVEGEQVDAQLLGQLRRHPEHVVPARVEPVHEDDPVPGLLPGDARLVVREVPSVLEPDPRRRHRGPAGRSGDPGSRGLQLPVQQRHQEDERQAREPLHDACACVWPQQVARRVITLWNPR
jgi:hypothetical protein